MNREKGNHPIRCELEKTRAIRDYLASVEVEPPENLEIAIGLLSSSCPESPVNLTSLACLNYIGGRRIEPLSESGIEIKLRREGGGWGPYLDRREFGQSRGHIALTQEIPRVFQSLTSRGATLTYVPILVDIGTIPVVTRRYSEPQLEELKERNRKDYSDRLLSSTSSIPQAKIHPFQRLSLLIDESIKTEWQETTKRMEKAYKEALKYQHKDTENRLGAAIRQAIRENKGYQAEHYGITDKKEVEGLTIRHFFALTYTVGKNLGRLVGRALGKEPLTRDEVILLDVLPGPSNPGHKEFACYNELNLPEENLPSLPILRVLRNTQPWYGPSGHEGIY